MGCGHAGLQIWCRYSSQTERGKPGSLSKMYRLLLWLVFWTAFKYYFLNHTHATEDAYSSDVDIPRLFPSNSFSGSCLLQSFFNDHYIAPESINLLLRRLFRWIFRKYIPFLQSSKYNNLINKLTYEKINSAESTWRSNIYL